MDYSALKTVMTIRIPKKNIVRYMGLHCHHINGRAKTKITRSDCTIAKDNITIHIALNKKQLGFDDKVKQVLKLGRDTELSLADKSKPRIYSDA